MHTQCTNGSLGTGNENSSTAIYNTIYLPNSQVSDKNGEDGPAYDVLSRGKSTGICKIETTISYFIPRLRS